MKSLARFSFNSDTAQTVDASSAITFSSITTNNQSINSDGAGGIIFKKAGTYRISANFTVVATAAGAVQIQMLEGSSVTTRAGETLAAVGDIASLSIGDYVTIKPNASSSYATITFAPTAATSIQTATVLVERIN